MKKKMKKISIALIVLLMVIAGTLAWLTTSEFKKGKINAGNLDASNFIVEKVVYDEDEEQFVLADEEDPSKAEQYTDSAVGSVVHYSSTDLYPVSHDNKEAVDELPTNYIRITNASSVDLYVELGVGDYEVVKNATGSGDSAVAAAKVDAANIPVHYNATNDAFVLGAVKAEAAKSKMLAAYIGEQAAVGGGDLAKSLANILKVESFRQDPRVNISNLLEAMELGVSFRFNIPFGSYDEDNLTSDANNVSGFYQVRTFGKVEEENGDATNINNGEEDPHMYVRELDEDVNVNEYVLDNVDEDDEYADTLTANCLLDLVTPEKAGVNVKIPFILKAGTSIVVPFKAFLNEYADNLFNEYTFYYNINVKAKNYMDGDGFLFGDEEKDEEEANSLDAVLEKLYIAVDKTNSLAVAVGSEMSSKDEYIAYLKADIPSTVEDEEAIEHYGDSINNYARALVDTVSTGYGDSVDLDGNQKNNYAKKVLLDECGVQLENSDSFDYTEYDFYKLTKEQLTDFFDAVLKDLPEEEYMDEAKEVFGETFSYYMLGGSLPRLTQEFKYVGNEDNAKYIPSGEAAINEK